MTKYNFHFVIERAVTSHAVFNFGYKRVRTQPIYLISDVTFLRHFVIGVGPNFNWIFKYIVFEVEPQYPVVWLSVDACLLDCVHHGFNFVLRSGLSEHVTKSDAFKE